VYAPGKAVRTTGNAVRTTRNAIANTVYALGMLRHTSGTTEKPLLMPGNARSMAEMRLRTTRNSLRRCGNRR